MYGLVGHDTAWLGRHAARLGWADMQHSFEGMCLFPRNAKKETA